MPNTFVDNRDAWLRMSDIDYLGQFVKTWLAFNAWYRSAYSEAQNRKIINEMKGLKVCVREHKRAAKSAHEYSIAMREKRAAIRIGGAIIVPSCLSTG